MLAPDVPASAGREVGDRLQRRTLLEHGVVNVLGRESAGTPQSHPLPRLPQDVTPVDAVE
jgi:hypothetical protein